MGTVMKICISFYKMWEWVDGDIRDILKIEKKNHCQLKPENDQSSFWQISDFAKTSPGQVASARISGLNLKEPLSLFTPV